MTDQNERGYCAWCFRPVQVSGPSGAYWCNSCDHSFNGPPLDADEVPFEQAHMMTEPNVKPEWA